MAAINLIRLVLHWSGYGEEGTIGWHLGGAPEASNEQLNACLVALNNDLGSDGTPPSWTNLSSLITGHQAWDRLQAYQYATGQGAARAQAELAVNHSGNNDLPYAGLQQAAAVTLLTGQPGRSYRGRVYMPGHMLSSFASDGQLTQAEVNRVGGLTNSVITQSRTSFQSTLESNAIFVGVFSRTRQVITEVKSVRMDSRLDVQRRRAASEVPSRTAEFTTSQAA